MSAEAEIEQPLQESPEAAQEEGREEDALDQLLAEEAAARSENGEEQQDAAQSSQPEQEEDPWAEALAEQLEEEADAARGSARQGGGGEGYSPAPLDPLEETATGGAGGARDVDLDLILDIPVTIAMEIGRTKINIRNLLQLNQGSVVELDRLAGEPLDVMVNGKLIAHGEVVVVNEKFGIRVTDVVSPQERIKNLKR